MSGDRTVEVRARSIREALYEIDFEPAPRRGVAFCEEWEAECMADYRRDCRLQPDIQLPGYEEYKLDWFDWKTHCEAERASVEAALERAADEACRAPLPLASPCGDADEDYPF